MSDVYREFIELVERQLSCTRELLGLLTTEHRALSNPDPSAINELLPRKLRCLQQLDELDKRREALCPLNQAADPAAVFAKVVDSFPAELQPQIQSLWTQLRQSIGQAREHSQQNGRLIHLRQRSIEKGLRILKGQTAQSNVYDPKGRMQGFELKHHSIKA